MTGQSFCDGGNMENQIDSKHMQIIKEAIQLFSKKGFENTSVQDITNSANIAKGTFYLYFKSKDDLIEQVFDYCHDNNVDYCNTGLENKETAIDKLCLRMENAIKWAMNNKEQAIVERMYLSYPKRREGMGTPYTKQKHFLYVDPIIQSGIESGELKNLPSVLLGEVFFGVAGAYYRYAKTNPKEIENKEMWELCKQTVVDCLSNTNK